MMDKINFDFKNRTAVVTGCAQGFGLDIAKRFLKSGAKVIIWDTDSKMVEKAIKDLDNSNLSSKIVDVSIYKDVENCANEIMKNSNIDILINNAGIGEFAKLENIKVNHFESIFATNVFGLTMLTQEVVKFFKTQQYGMIINIGSSAATSGFPSGSVYCASKFALRGLTECWSHELRRDNIRVVLVNPSEVPTAFNNKDRVEREEQENKLSSKDISHAIVSAINMDKRGFIPELNVWATNPF